MHEDIVSFISGECIKMSNQQQLEEAFEHLSSISSICSRTRTKLFDFLRLADLERAHADFREYGDHDEIINAESRRTANLYRPRFHKVHAR
ncbi:unnamed protein product [Lasius platythorax]|uniref:Uncharacterized protein n=1 Tax=Lasius platythorax TaxID=488582 RepID=A0AAV2NHH3_9HYME